MKFKSKLSALLISTAMVLGLGATIGAVAEKNPVKASADVRNITPTGVDGTYSGVTVKAEQGSGITEPGMASKGLRMYMNNTLTISSAEPITAISFTWTSSGVKTFASVTAGVGEYSHPTHDGTGTWAGNATSIVFTVGNEPQCQIILPSLSVTISDAPATFDFLSITTPPTKTVYKEGEKFDATGMVVTKNFSDLTTQTTSEYTVAPSGVLTSADTSVTITSTENTSISPTYAITVNAPTLLSIYITDASDMTKKAYNKNTAWDYTGLVVMAHYDAGEDVDASTLGTVTFTPSVATAVLGTTSITVTASYSTFTSAAKTITGITVSDTVVYDLTTNFATYASGWSSSYAAYEITEQDIGGTGTELPGLTVSFAVASKQTTTITTMPVSNTSGLFLTVTLTDTTKSIASVRVNFEQWTTMTPTMTLYSGTTATGTALDTGVIGTQNYVATNALTSSSFVVSSSSTDQRGIKSIEIVFATTSETDDAATWAGFFLTDLVCDSTGVIAPKMAEWTTLEGLFTSDLSDGAKAVIRTANGNASGTDIQKAVLKYDYIIGKYGTTYTNYIGRSVVTSAVKNPLSDNVNNDSYMAIIVIIGLIGFTSVGAFFYVRKHKEQ